MFISDYEKSKSLELYESIKSDSGNWSPWNKKTWPMKALATQDGKKHGNIHGSVISNDVEMLKDLLSSGININVKDESGNTPLDYANDKMRKFLSNHGAKTSNELKLNESKLTASARDGNIQKVRSYLTIGVDVNSIDEDGHSMLHWNIKPEIIELLIASGADINIISKHGRTALDFANMRKHKETADLLRKHGGKTGEELKTEGKMKQLLITIAAVVLVGCATTQQSIRSQSQTQLNPLPKLQIQNPRMLKHQTSQFTLPPIKET